MATDALTPAEKFFYDNAGFSYARDETPEQGRKRGARELAAAEAWLRSGPYYIDVYPDDTPWDGDVPYHGPLWCVTLYGVADTDRPTVLDSVNAVACEAGSPYLRIVAAELAAAALASV
jgi:hypothetical protein